MSDQDRIRKDAEEMARAFPLPPRDPRTVELVRAYAEAITRAINERRGMIYVVMYVDPYEDGVPSEVRSAWTRRDDAEEAVRREQRRVSSIDWKSISGYEVVEVELDHGIERVTVASV